MRRTAWAMVSMAIAKAPSATCPGLMPGATPAIAAAKAENTAQDASGLMG